MAKIRISDVVGSGYRDFWNYKGRYRVLKGGRGSKKSTTTALWIVYHMMRFWHEYNQKPHTLVVRRYFNTHSGSTFNQLRWAIGRLQVSHLWKTTKSPLQLTYIPSGQCIYFRGLDDPQSITSIVASEGHLCWCWWEEAFQITDEKAFDMVDMSIRGEIPEPLFKQHTVTMNPWSDKHWIKRRFYDSEHENVQALTKNYDVNEFLGQDDVAIFDEMKDKNPRRYSIEGLGEWGISEGLVYENWEELDFNESDLLVRRTADGRHRFEARFGLDFGYTNHPTAFIYALVSETDREIYIYDEIYKTRLGNAEIYREISSRGYADEIIIADNEGRTIAELRKLGLHGIRAAKKGPGSVRAGIQKIQDYKIFVHPRCVNTLVELSNYVWSRDKLNNSALLDPVKDFDHALDALRYLMEPVSSAVFVW